MKKDTNKYPKGLDAKKVRAILDYHENQTEDEAIAEAEAAWENSRTSLVRVPIELAAEVRGFVESRMAKGSTKGKSKKRKVA
ncbi:MAG: hypothetical protein AABZ53_17130 [Planctomycetota bacterium]